MKTVLRFSARAGLIVLVFVMMIVESPAAPSADRSPSSTLIDTPTFAVPINVEASQSFSYGLNFGIHPRATNGIDPGLGEMEYPPFPPCCGVAMMVTPGGNAMLDLRPFVTPTQIDTYRVGVSPESISYPIRFSWPDMHTFYSGPVRMKSDLNGSLFDIDMKGQSSYTLLNGPFIYYDGRPIPGGATLTVYIIAEGPVSIGNLPLVSTYGFFNGGLYGTVHTPSAPGATPGSATNPSGTTNVWFEYGPTRGYGSTTAPHVVADGTNGDVSDPFDPSSLPMNSRLHFRAVAQNTSGTFYGADKIVSNGTPPPENEAALAVTYRTASYKSWADAKDQKDKRKAVKCTPAGVDFDFVLPAWALTSTLTLKFPFPTSGTCTVHGTPALEDTFPAWSNQRTVAFSRTTPLPFQSSDTFHIVGRGFKGKKISVSYCFDAGGGCASKGTVPAANFVTNTPLLPMPNLHNVGQDMYGGISQTPVTLTIGSNASPKNPHTVYLPKYQDVLKSLAKEQKGSVLYHFKPARCLDVKDKTGKPIDKQQKGLPPDIHNNKLFGAQLALRLNLAASDSGLFPEGLGDLLYNNTSGPAVLNGLSLRALADSVDRFLGCNLSVMGGLTADDFFLADSLVNAAFDGPMDTVSWSCATVQCTGVRELGSVPYLLPSPAGVPGTVFARHTPTPYVAEPAVYALRQNYPNPFNPTTRLSFTLGGDAMVSLTVYNTLGQVVATPAANEEFAQGENEVEFDGSSLASGVYFYRLQAKPLEGSERPFSDVRKMVLIR